MQATIPEHARADAPSNSLWLHSAAYDLCLFAFPWIPFILVVVYGLEWQGDYSLSNNRYTFKLVVAFLFALNFTHRNYTYFVTYGDHGVFRARKTLLTLVPLLVFPAILAVYVLRHPLFLKLLLAGLALWNLWHVIMQRHGIFRGYAAKLKHGLETKKHARLDLLLLWVLTLFSIALGAILYLPLAKSHRLARTTYTVLAPFFTSYPVPIAVTLGCCLGSICLYWSWREWAEKIPFKARIPRLAFLASTLSLFGLMLLNPILGLFAFGFSHSIEYVAYVHATQKKKVVRHQYAGGMRQVFWQHMLLGALIFVGLQVLMYYSYPHFFSKQNIYYKTFIKGTAVLHFLYDGIIWKRSKRLNKGLL